MVGMKAYIVESERKCGVSREPVLFQQLKAMEQLNPNPMLSGLRPGGMMPVGGFPSNIALPRPAMSSPLLNEQ